MQDFEMPVRPDHLADKLGFGDVQWMDSQGRLLWLENRSDRGVLVAGDSSGRQFWDLSREPIVRAGVGYGGGDFNCLNSSVCFISKNKLYVLGNGEIIPCLVYTSEGDLASPLSSPSGDRVAFIESWKDRERLALVFPTEGSVVDVDSESDFRMQPAWHPSGRYLAWISWNHPHMPWEKSSVKLASVGSSGSIEEVAGLEEEVDSAVFQPAFSPDGRYLAFASDRNGWSNLQVYSFPSLELQVELNESWEHALPAWQQGMRTLAWASESKSIYLIRHSGGFSNLGRFDLETGTLDRLGGELKRYTSLAQISVSTDDQIAMIGSSSCFPERILVTDNSGAVRVIRESLPGHFPDDPTRDPLPLTWKVTAGGKPEASGDPLVNELTAKGKQSSASAQECHGLFYRAWEPANPEEENSRACSAPAVIRIHGGPTSCYSADFDPAVLFYTSRGFSVLSLNYRGSTGYGRVYRSLLDKRWGILDVEDVKGAADYLVEQELAERDRIMLDGGSAGGFTLLSAMIRYPGRFKAGICRYGVADLLSLARDTHRFESHYLDSLIGRLPENIELYRSRSPVTRIAELKDPLAVFQGGDDPVVPPDQAEAIVKSLKERGVPHIFRVYEGEGHGWKKKETIRDYYDAVDEFLSWIEGGRGIDF